MLHFADCRFATLIFFFAFFTLPDFRYHCLPPIFRAMPLRDVCRSAIILLLPLFSMPPRCYAKGSSMQRSGAARAVRALRVRYDAAMLL